MSSPSASQPTPAPSTPHGDVNDTPQKSEPLPASAGKMSDRDPIPRAIYPRQDTVSKLAAAVDSENVVLVRGTPATGKTTLCRLLQEYYLEYNRNVYWIPMWGRLKAPSEDPWTRFSCRLRQIDPEFDTTWASVPAKTVILIDEAQGSYRDEGFWNTVIKDVQSRLCLEDIKICLFAYCGDPVTGVDRRDLDYAYTPTTFGTASHITLTPQPGLYSVNIGLFYTEDEFREVVARQTTLNFDDVFAIDHTAMDYLYKLTSAHPGIVTAVVDFLFKAHRDLIKQGKIHTITLDHVLEVLQDKNQFFRSIENHGAFRSFPPHSALDSKTLDVLGQILAKGSMPFDFHNKAMRTCSRRGWVHRTLETYSSEGWTGQRQREVVVLPSHVHEMWVEWVIDGREKC